MNKSWLIIESFSDKINERLLFYKYFVFLNRISIKSQNGRIPVPPQIIITFPSGLSLSNAIPLPIGFEIMQLSLKPSSKSYEVNYPV